MAGPSPAPSSLDYGMCGMCGEVWRRDGLTEWEFSVKALELEPERQDMDNSQRLGHGFPLPPFTNCTCIAFTTEPVVYDIGTRIHYQKGFKLYECEMCMRARDPQLANVLGGCLTSPAPAPVNADAAPGGDGWTWTPNIDADAAP